MPRVTEHPTHPRDSTAAIYGVLHSALLNSGGGQSRRRRNAVAFGRHGLRVRSGWTLLPPSSPYWPGTAHPGSYTRGALDGHEKVRHQAPVCGREITGRERTHVGAIPPSLGGALRTTVRARRSAGRLPARYCRRDRRRQALPPRPRTISTPMAAVIAAAASAIAEAVFSGYQVGSYMFGTGPRVPTST